MDRVERIEKSGVEIDALLSTKELILELTLLYYCLYLFVPGGAFHVIGTI